LFGRYFGLTGAERSRAEKNKETEKPVISRGTGDRKRSGKKSGHFRLPSAAPSHRERDVVRGDFFMLPGKNSDAIQVVSMGIERWFSGIGKRLPPGQNADVKTISDVRNGAT